MAILTVGINVIMGMTVIMTVIMVVTKVVMTKAATMAGTANNGLCLAQGVSHRLE